MKKLYSAVLGIDQGTAVLFSDFQHEGEMWSGKGPRERATAVVFEEPFREEPSITVALNLFDASNTTNLRYEVVTDNVTRVGFDIVFKTWGDTKIARARAAWTAIGAVDGDGDWDV